MSTKLIGNLTGETSGYDLNNLINVSIPENKLNEIGRVEIKWSNEFKPGWNGGQILNLGDNTASGMGTHWVATFRNKDSLHQSLRDGVYFDSYGLYPPVTVELAGFDYTPLHLQSYELRENFCGQWCVVFLKYCYMDDLAGFYAKWRNLHRGWGV